MQCIFVIQIYERGLHVLLDDDDDGDNDNERGSRRNAKRKADASAVSEVERDRQQDSVAGISYLLSVNN